MNKLRAIGKTVLQTLMPVLLITAVLGYFISSMYCFLSFFFYDNINLGLFICSIPGVAILAALTVFGFGAIVYGLVSSLYELYKDNLKEEDN